MLADFDRILLDHAAKEGATVREDAEVGDLTFHDHGVRLGIQRGSGATEEVEASSWSMPAGAPP